MLHLTSNMKSKILHSMFKKSSSLKPWSLTFMFGLFPWLLPFYDQLFNAVTLLQAFNLEFGKGYNLKSTLGTIYNWINRVPSPEPIFPLGTQHSKCSTLKSNCESYRYFWLFSLGGWLIANFFTFFLSCSYS